MMKKFGRRRTIAALLIAVPIAMLPSAAFADDADTSTPSDSHWSTLASDDGTGTSAEATTESPLADSHW
ncbi:hypothetical protein ACQ86D_33750 [Streptomyces galilaeus]